jgi:HSP20 family protein
MAAKVEPKHIVERPSDWNMIEAAGENMLERFRDDLRDIGLDLELFQGRMENLMGMPFPRVFLPTMKGMATPLDIEETPTDYLVRMNLPGVPKELVGIRFRDQTLEIEAEAKAVKETEKKHYVLHERRETEYHRRLNFPMPVAPEKTEAKLEHGVLTVSVPKLKPAKELRVPLA